MSTPRSEATRSVDRAMDLLFALANQPNFTGVTALATQLGLGKSTVHRLLQTLVKEGMVAFNPNLQAYGLGGRSLQLGLTYQEHHPLIPIARPTLEKFRDLTTETATIYLPIGLSCVALDNAVGTDGPRVPSRDAKAPLHVGAFGKVLYAYAPEEFRAHYQAEGRKWDGKAVPPIPTEEECAEIRERGYALSMGELRPRTNGIGFPLLNGQGEILASVSIAGRSERWTEERMNEFLPELLLGMEDLSRKTVDMEPDQKVLLGLAERGLLPA